MSSSQAAHADSNATYIKVFIWLAVLTALELGIVYQHIARAAMIGALVILALMKAFLVAWHYMHLKGERWTLIVVAVLPLLLIVDLLIGILPDIGHIIHF